MHIFTRAAIAALVLAAAPAAAAPTSHFERWLAGAVDARMDYPWALARAEIGGVATVRFEAGADGRPRNVALVRSSGVAALDRAALATVAGIERIPAGAPAGPHLVVLQYGAAATDHQAAEGERQVRVAIAEARALGARSGPGGGAVVSTIH